MNIKCNGLLLATSLAIIGFTVRTAVADEWNKETVIRVDQPVEVPGAVLQPGKYVFRLFDSQSNRNIVQIFSEDDNGRQHLLTTFFAVPSYRFETPEKPIIQFDERHAGAPEAIKKWFYPGENTGWEFVYPKTEQLEANVIAAPAAVPATEPVAAPEPFPAEPAAEPATAVVEEQTVVAELQPLPALDEESSRDRILPSTAGYSIAILIAGAAMLCAGLLAFSISRVRA